MKYSIYTFITKDGKKYTHSGSNNRFEAQTILELAFHIDLSGATFQEYFKNQLVRTGLVH